METEEAEPTTCKKELWIQRNYEAYNHGELP